MRLAYSFEDSKRPRHMHRALSDEPGQQRLQYLVREWNELWRSSRPVLQVYDDGDRVRFFDTRPCAIQRSWTIEGLEAEIYRLCDSARTRAALKSQLSATEDLEPAISNLLSSKVLLSMNDKLLALGVNQTSRAGA